MTDAITASALQGQSAPASTQADSALIVVDMQNGFMPGGNLPVNDGDKIIPVLHRLAAVFDNIILTQDWHPVGHISFASSHPGKKAFDSIITPYGEQLLWPDHCIQGTKDAALHPDLVIPAAQLIIRKGYRPSLDSYSAFEEADHQTATGLAGYLKERAISRVYLAGLATDFCVAWTAMDARKFGFETYVIEDATRAIDTQGSLTKAWRDMDSKGVIRITSEELA